MIPGQHTRLQLPAESDGLQQLRCRGLYLVNNDYFRN